MMGKVIKMNLRDIRGVLINISKLLVSQKGQLRRVFFTAETRGAK